jgi:flagellin
MTSLRTNVASLNAQRLVGLNEIDLARTSERLSTGLRINSAQDDPAGVGLVEQLTAEIRGGAAATLNVEIATSAIQIADDGLSQIGEALQRMRELAVQGNNTALSTSESAALDTEYQALMTSIDEIALSATFNDNVLLDGSFPNGGQLTVQSGANQAQVSSVDFSGDFQSASLGVTGTDLTDATNSAAAQTAVDAAIDTVTQARGVLGAKQSALDAVKSNLDTASVANQDARMRIRDADVAAEVANLVRQQLLQQSGASALSAANMSPSFLVSILSK